MLQKFCSFRIKYLKLHEQDLTLKDFHSINEASSLVTVRLIDVNIFNDVEFTTLESVVACFPSVKNFYLKTDSLIYTEKSAENIANLNRKIKFREFVLFRVPNTFEPNDFCVFIKKHLEDYGIVHVKFPNVDDSINFSEVIEEFLLQWQPKNAAPIFYN